MFKRHSFWLCSSLLLPLYFGCISLHHAFSQAYIVQDDARQHVVWLQRAIDPQLFSDDLIAQYFLTVEPEGYKFFYTAIAKLGIEPLLFARFLPILLGAIATVYLFEISLKILPLPGSAFLSTLILNQHLWLNDDLVSATPRAFIYPLFAAFLYYLLNRSLVPCLVTIALQGLFFPLSMFIAVAVLTVRLLEWRGRLQFSQQKADYVFWVSGLLVAAIVLLPFALKISEFGAAITAAQMKTMPEYGLGGRSEYFGVSPFNFILNGASGLRIPVFPTVILVGFGLPFFLKSSSPIVRLVTAEVKILVQVMLASLGMFLLAHLLLLKLHFPNRYTYHSWRFVLSIAAGIVLTVLLERGWRWWQCRQAAPLSRRERWLTAGVGTMMAIAIIVPAIPPIFFQFQGWTIGEAPELYQYLAQQPEDTLIASLAKEANNLPAFARRSTLVGREFALAHHPAYYRQMRQRIVDVIQAQYSPDIATVQRVINQYGIDFFLIESTAFEPDYLLQQDWLIHSSFRSTTRKAVRQLIAGTTPALAKRIDRCTALSTRDLILLQADCLKTR